MSTIELAVVYFAHMKPRSDPPRFPYVDYVLSMYNIIQLGSTVSSSLLSFAFQEAAVVNFWVTLAKDGMSVRTYLRKKRKRKKKKEKQLTFV